MRQKKVPTVTMTQPEKVDSIVVGGGIVGLLVALELAQQGQTVRLVDKDLAGPVRTHIGELSWLGGEPAMDALFAHSLKCWKEAAVRYGIDLGLATRGVLDLGSSGGRIARLAEEADAAHRAGVTGLLMQQGAETLSNLAGTPLGTHILKGLWWAEGNVLSTHTALDVLRRQLAVKGVRIWGQDEVSELLVEMVGNTERVTGVRIKSGETSLATHVILTAGAKAGALLKKAGPHIPLRPARTHLLTLSGGESLGFPLLVHRLRRGHLWLKRLREGPVLVAYDGLMDPTQATFKLAPDDAIVNALRSHVAELVPALKGANLAQCSVATAAVTPDFKPVIGLWPGLDGLVVATGFAARSYAFAAGAARLVASLVAGTAPAVELAAFAPNRFAAGTWAKVPHPPSLNWPEHAGVASQTQLVGAEEADFANNVQMTSKPDAKFASNVQQREKKMVTAASSAAAKAPRKERGKIQMGSVKSV
jgi:glycine/D-amino acid oxidase-like deaminating enzyme